MVVKYKRKCYKIRTISKGIELCSKKKTVEIRDISLIILFYRRENSSLIWKPLLIALEKQRYNESLQVNFSNDIEDINQAIPRLLLIPLVENAFKHGVSETTTRPLVDIFLPIKNQQSQFIVRNSTDDRGDNGNVNQRIGLTNLRRY